MNESSSQDASTDDATRGVHALDQGDDAAPESAEGDLPAGGVAVVPAAPPAEEEPPIAPDVERLGRPEGTAGAIPETILGPRPSPVFLVTLAAVTFVADIATKLWAEHKLTGYPGFVTVFEDHLMFVLAKNKGGAWGLLQSESENVRRPFFLVVSVAAIAFIVTLYRRLQPHQHALKWGLPLVLGGALGNVFDRIRYGYVIDFIDYRSEAVRKMNELIQRAFPSHMVTDHWPTFNVADIAICVGVGLMAVDMVTSMRGPQKPAPAPEAPVEPEPTATSPTAEVSAEGGANDVASLPEGAPAGDATELAEPPADAPASAPPSQ